MASVRTIIKAKGSAKFLIKKNCESMASVLADSRQKSPSMAPVPLQPKQKSASMALGGNRGPKAPPFGLAPLCLSSKTEVE